MIPLFVCGSPEVLPWVAVLRILPRGDVHSDPLRRLSRDPMPKQVRQQTRLDLLRLCFFWVFRGIGVV